MWRDVRGVVFLGRCGLLCDSRGMTQRRIEHEYLIGQLPVLRRLAVALVGSGEADDLVQHTARIDVGVNCGLVRSKSTMPDFPNPERVTPRRRLPE
jgi:hypothetical protein